MLDFERFQWLSFDCYGTLVDWETGISDAVADSLVSHDIRMSRSEILALFAEVEPQIQQGGRYLEYRRVLRRVVAMMGIKLGVQFSESEMNCLVDTIGSWPVFPDTRDALRAMKSRYNLAIISNVDDDLFAPTADALGSGTGRGGHRPAVRQLQARPQELPNRAGANGHPKGQVAAHRRKPVSRYCPGQRTRNRVRLGQSRTWTRRAAQHARQTPGRIWNFTTWRAWFARWVWSRVARRIQF